MRSFVLLLAVLSLSIPACFAGADKTLLSARESILLSSAAPQTALIKYTEASKRSIAAPVTAEYAYALAWGGVPEAALFNMDRALIEAPLDAGVRFYLSEIFNAFGLEDASSELAAPVPGWLKAPLKLPVLDVPAPTGDLEHALAVINLLMVQKRYVESAVLFDRLCKANASAGQCYAGYAIALEKLGAYKSAAAEAEKDLALSDVPGHRTVAQAYITGLEKRAPLKYGVSPEQGLKGRYLAFLGGNVSNAPGYSAYSVNGRVGKFISDRFDLSVNGGLNGGNSDSDYNGLTLGCSGRYNAPLSFLPVNGTLGAKAERIPAPEKGLTFLLSPGLSYFMRNSSVDVYLDIALAGAYSGSRTLSVGYTFYFGGGK